MFNNFGVRNAPEEEMTEDSPEEEMMDDVPVSPTSFHGPISSSSPSCYAIALVETTGAARSNTARSGTNIVELCHIALSPGSIDRHVRKLRREYRQPKE